jgi:hypothetical protein
MQVQESHAAPQRGAKEDGVMWAWGSNVRAESFLSPFPFFFSHKKYENMKI